MSTPDHVRRWETRRLRDAVTKLVDGSHNPPPKQDAGQPMLSARNVENGQILFDNFRYISDESFAVEHARTQVAPGDVLLTIVGTIGRTTVVPEGIGLFALQRSVAVLSPKQDLLPKFLSYQLQSPAAQRYFEANARGTAQKGIYLKTLGEAPIGIPPLDEQREIVEEIEKQFSRLDEAVANLKCVTANLGRYKSAVLGAAVRGDLTGLRRQDRHLVAMLPHGWRWVTVQEVASSEARSIQSGPFGSNLKHSEFQTSGKLVIGIDNVQDGRFSIGAEHRIRDAKFKELQKYAARPGDVLITVMATIGRTCVVPDDLEPAIITKHVYRITVNRDIVLPHYLCIALRGGETVRAQLLGSVQGQTRPGLNGSILRRIQIPVPSIAEQVEIIAEVQRRLSIAEEIASALDSSRRRAERLRQTVIGRLVGQVPKPGSLPMDHQ